MINITNETAAREARKLAHDLMGTSLSNFGRLPNGTGLWQLLNDVGVRLNLERSGRLFLNRPHETVELIANDADMAGRDHASAVQELTECRTADLQDEDGTLTAEDVENRRDVVHTNLTSRRDKLSAPLSLVSRIPGLRARAEARRSEQQAELMAVVASALSGVPLSPSAFEEVFASTLSVAGLAVEQMSERQEIKGHAIARHREFRDRWETVLMLAWEAIATDESGADPELSTEGRHRRFYAARATARAREIEEADATARQRAADKKAAREREQKKAQISREIEESRKLRRRARRYYVSDDEREPDDGLTYPG